MESKVRGRLYRGLLVGALGWMLAVGLAFAGGQATYPLGDIPLDPETYDAHLRVWPDQAVEQLPSSYDARNDGIVTSPKNQGNCGSCWAFASAGAFESHLMKQYGLSATDLSEQQQVSCNPTMSGCCGGSSSALKYWETRGPVYESCFPYGDGSTSCPIHSSVSCSTGSGCTQLSYRVANWHTVTVSTEQFKTSLYNDGPSYFRYDVYGDFFNFWNTASSGSVYQSQAGYSKEGGHAVLLIGWSDSKGAYLLKNSWGATGGPNGDGTFWMAYSGHYHNLNFQMANFSLTTSSSEWEYAYQLLFDDPNLLDNLRLFRDSHLLASPKGRLLVRGLYENSIPLLNVLLSHPELMDQARLILASNAQAVRDVVAGKGGTIEDTEAVLVFLEELEAVSSPPLRRFLKSLGLLLGRHRDQGRPFFGFDLR